MNPHDKTMKRWWGATAQACVLWVAGGALAMARDPAPTPDDASMSDLSSVTTLSPARAHADVSGCEVLECINLSMHD